MWEWSDKLRLGKSSAFVKRDLQILPLTEAEFEADFFLDPEFSTKNQEIWIGMVVERKSGGLLATENVHLPPPTVNNLARLLAQAMKNPPIYEDRQRPRLIYLRDRPQWKELLPHLQQMEIDVVLCDDLPRFDEAVLDWIRQSKTQKVFFPDKIKSVLPQPFPERKRTWFTDVMTLMEWSDAMFKGAYPSRRIAVPAYGPMTVVPVCLMADELEAILTKTEIGRTKKLRPRLEAMAANGKAIELDINEWSRVVLALCGPPGNEVAIHRHLLEIGTRIADQLAKALGIDGPSGGKSK
jgi:hypothetical protein